ncbi:hypothetical protein, partial [Salinispora arenicola]|uniref:hypothetical protein n=1 Tax=Salinispora arenicola TaxID=168697 RepID=UPI0027DD89D8
MALRGARLKTPGETVQNDVELVEDLDDATPTVGASAWRSSGGGIHSTPGGGRADDTVPLA